jgi:MarR family transcriptional regulator, 2-MHQ and catechol-resistance regulon repressor
MPCLEIADRMIQVVPAITGLIDRLEAADMVSRHRCQNDRRIMYIEITPKARKILAQIDDPLQALHHKLVGHLSSTELLELNRLLEKARESLSEK